MTDISSPDPDPNPSGLDALASWRLIAGAVVVAGIVHAIAAHHLAATDPIAALLGHRHPGARAAIVALAAARLFLLFVAPAWAAHFVVKMVARAVYKLK
jgi:hypothetical protein